ncbi:MAG: hypothetical protein K2X48_12355 [Chitinophagaceae bacterium]|nr:hypothetical protein [Chitinophagaceae bacterium]
MKTLHEINKTKVPAVRIDKSLDKYDDIVLFPEKLAKANQKIMKSGFPVLNEKKKK